MIISFQYLQTEVITTLLEKTKEDIVSWKLVCSMADFCPLHRVNSILSPEFLCAHIALNWLTGTVLQLQNTPLAWITSAGPSEKSNLRICSTNIICQLSQNKSCCYVIHMLAGLGGPSTKLHCIFYCYTSAYCEYFLSISPFKNICVIKVMRLYHWGQSHEFQNIEQMIREWMYTVQISLTLSSSSDSDIYQLINLGPCIELHLCSVFSSAKWFQSCTTSTLDGYYRQIEKLGIFI